MKVVQKLMQDPTDIAPMLAELAQCSPQLILVFGSATWLRLLAPVLQAQFAPTLRLGCTTAGEISGQGVSDGCCVLTAVHFDQVWLHGASTPLASMQASFAAGKALAAQLPTADLRSVLVLGQGVNINGSQMIAGIRAVLGDQVLVTGGLAGDDAAFKETFVLTNDGVFSDQVTCVGLYGSRLQVSHGSFGGWEPFGPARKVTRCIDNVLYELDGEPALDVYKRYLGDHARGLPASGLLFPFAMLGDQYQDMGLLRTILAIDEVAGSLTLAGDIVNNGYLRLMHASTQALIQGAQTAAESACLVTPASDQSLALLVSCVGRKLVMGGRVEEEVEAVAEVLSQGAVLAGFYSYGEISPLSNELSCQLHNQTMTITTLAEANPS
ncbi:MAG: FIST C-terminal domain-containing protein [Rhodoferax sp.]|uniref:FIST signal transduction protein n=1 Tax=Rhodoferax sp. TaxID=50421 RepID=UPI001B72F382|nr:FIST N-terminal domain-containing protein [Rhodoferax sp.]MBP9906332.1 FIST C-terminal domain-containing protein [Rhodoferax sp.]